MEKIRVLVVDDAVVMRKLISEVLARDPDVAVVGTASDGRFALQKVAQLSPDIITLDVEMPEMDGVTTLRELRKTHPRLPVIMFSSVTSRGAAATLDALSAGATDYVAKPANVGSVTECIDRLESELLAKIKTHGRRRPEPTSPASPGFAFAHRSPPVVARPIASAAEVVCIGTSTGGPNALEAVFRQFRPGFPLPILVVQHMPPLFTAMLADRLDKVGPIRFCEGAEGQVVEAGHAYLAPGGKHMEARRAGANVLLHLQEEPPENSCRPAADVLFRSVATAYNGRILGVVMTGMGHDGTRGCEIIRARGGQIVVQDEASSVVWGMPGSVASAGFADAIVPLNDIAAEISRRARGRPAVVS